MADLNQYSLEQLQGIVNLGESLVNNPQTREQFLRLAKQANPNLQIPEIATKDSFQTELQKEREARLNLEKQIQERDIRENLQKTRANVQSKFKLNDEQMSSVETLMVEKQIPSYETAAEFLVNQQKAAAPTINRTTDRPMITMPDAAIWSKGVGDKSKLNNIAREEAYKAWDEINS
ncbi:hypothetical protein [Paludibacterium sp.]|uniref:hypothetical protein n=1 Tax=Paludibacterium sp. TaxID=1917523 RepID=UPI0025FF793F|nr:hypothetical protein [Paludibacterium sp.]MBV8648468.1 hypothetical protein [Paludibacterium sp.]